MGKKERVVKLQVRASAINSVFFRICSPDGFGREETRMTGTVCGVMIARP